VITLSIYNGVQHENQPMLMPKFKTKVQIFSLGSGVLVQVPSPINLGGVGGEGRPIARLNSNGFRWEKA
jgi:hypothetical protein